jgi:hypothetical protein
MTNLEQAWRAWRGLSRTDRARFLILLREAYARQREIAMRQNDGGSHGVRVSSLADLTLTEADLLRARP